MSQDSSKKEGMVPLEEAREQVRRACVRLALLHYAFARTLVEELGDERGKQMAMNAIKLYSKVIGEGVREKVLAQGLDNSPENYQEDLPRYGLHGGLETVNVDGEKRIRAYDCVLARVWNDLGASDLGRLYCYIDAAKYMAYNPACKLVHCKAIPDGDEYCELVVRPTTEQDREEFAQKDTDLSVLDT